MPRTKARESLNCKTLQVMQQDVELLDNDKPRRKKIEAAKSEQVLNTPIC
jgi:hypothetical protein